MSNVTLAQGGGGEEFGGFVDGIRGKLKFTGGWENVMDDGATISFDLIGGEEPKIPPAPLCERGDQLKIPCLSYQGETLKTPQPPFAKGGNIKNPPTPPCERGELNKTSHLVFTTDSFVVDPLFFAGGDIGKIAFCGTVNDLAMMGARPLGLSLAFIIEEGLDQKIVDKILESINAVSESERIPIVTGDTKVMGKGQIDKIAVITSGVGIAENVIKDGGMNVGDAIIVSGSIGDHGATLLAARFDYETELASDCKPLVQEIQEIKNLITSCKDITRGGVAAIFNEMSKKGGVKFFINENKIPFKKEVISICKILGISQYALACEGRFVCTAPNDKADEVVEILKKFNSDAAVVGEVVSGSGVVLKTELGERILELPRGKLVPRIC
ncbi:MAG: hydrogenase expression/formation protein HypE [bacterium]